MNQRRCFALLVLACLMFAGQGTAIKYLNRQLGPVQLTFLPFATATLLMLPLLVRLRRDPLRRGPTAPDWPRFVVAGVGGQVLAQLGMAWGITRSLASNAAILGLLLPVMSTLLAVVWLHEGITRLRVLAFANALAGVLLLSADSLHQSALTEMRYLSGNLLIVAGVTGSAFYNVYCKSLFQKFSQVEVLISSYIAASIAGLFLIVWLEQPSPDLFATLTWQSWLGFGYQAVVTYGLAMLLFFKALKHLDVSTASLSLYLLPVFGVILATLLLGERLGWPALVGSAIVFASTLIAVKYDRTT
ncbi:MAG: DMT family transporter [Bryobacteraceae bacterium]|nr:DMT family transporter [Bryobacteraceae bacterium]